MSCLSVTELPLDEQVELELRYAEKLIQRIDALLRPGTTAPQRRLTMLQHEVRHPNNTFPRCRCGAQPRHIEARGALSTEAFDPFHPAGTRHSLECRCGARTAWLPTLAAAESDWRQHFAAPEPLTNVRTILRLHRTNKETA